MTEPRLPGHTSLPTVQEGTSRCRGTCGLLGLSGQRVWRLQQCLLWGSSPTGPAMNIEGDPAPGWEQAWGSGAQGPEKGSLEGG